MNHKANWWLSTVAVAVVATCAMPLAQAAGNRQPGQSLSAHERKAAIDVLKQNHNRFKQPQTEAEARTTLLKRSDGAQSARVPLSLWNTLSVAPDAVGAPHMQESDGSAPATRQEGPAHE